MDSRLRGNDGLTALGIRHLALVLALITHYALLTTPTASAQIQRQELPSPLTTRNISPRFEHLTLEDGLSQGSIFDIFQDRQGFMWFSTQDGLNRWDGIEFKVYTHQPFDSTTLSETWLSRIAEDEEGFLWVGTNSAGLNRFDPVREVATHFRHSPTDSTSLSSDGINDVLVAKDGTIWVATDKGLDRLDPDHGFAARRYSHNPDDSTTISSPTVWRLFQDSGGTIWALTRRGFNRLDSEEDGRFRRYMAGDYDAACSPFGVPELGFASILEREQEPGVLWLGTTNGLVRFDVESESSQRFIPDLEVPCAPFPDVATDPLNPGVFWIGIWSGGLVRFDIRSESFSVYQNDPNEPTSLPAGRVMNVRADRSGIIWLGGQPFGVSKFDPASVGVAHYRSIAGDPASLYQPSVYGIFQSRDGVVWVSNVGAQGWAVTAIDRANNRARHYLHDPNDPTSIGPRPLYNIFEDSRGTIWMTSRVGIHRLNRATGRFDQFSGDENDQNSLWPGGTVNFFEDQAGNLWVGSFGAVSRMPLDRPGYFTRFEVGPEDPDARRRTGSQFITEDLAGFIWVAMVDGLYRLDPKSGRVTSYWNDPSDPNSIPAPWVTCVRERTREPGIMWLSTSGGGISRLDVATGTFKHFTVREGLANNNTYGFVEDDEGRFWISTNRGLSRFDPDTEEFRNYGTDIGLQGLEFNSYAYHRGPYGEMFFGGTNGLNSFFPNELSENSKAPQVTLVDLKLFNESVTKTGVVPINHSISETEAVTLSHNQNDITFDFIAFHYADPEHNQYAYKLEGWNDDWVYVENQRTASFTNLDPGTYTFRVKAANSDGVWNEEGASIRIVVKPPFWATWWFRILAFFGIAGLAYAGYQARVEQISRRSRELESEVDRRTQELTVSNTQLEQSHTIVQAINQETSFRRLLTKILEESRVIPGVEKATALVHMAEDDRFHVRATSGWDLEAMRGIRLTASEAHRRYVEQADRVAEDIYVAKDVASRAGTEQMAEFGRVASFLVLRVLVEGTVVAYLVFDNLTDEDAFAQRDIELLERLRDHITSAFIKTRILEDLQDTLTSLRSTQDRLVQSEKMASLGQLTAGIAHEIKNPLNFVNNFSDVTAELADEAVSELDKLKGKVPDESLAELDSIIASLSANAKKIAEHGKRADSIVQNMLEHSKVGEGERTPTKLNDLLDEYVTLASHGLEARGGGFKVDVIREFDDSIGQVDLVPQDMGRVFMNLIGNAFDALREHGANGKQPTVTVTTALVDGSVEIRVADNGPGIPPKVKSKIFEPFFTTKPTGSGTGLGLSMSYDIVTKGHGGTLDVVSEVGQGATFVVRLPA